MDKPSREYATDASGAPQPVRGSAGTSDPGPRNVERDSQNPDMFAPPKTDSGTIPNLKFSFSDAHNRLQEGGWARQVTVRELPVATTLAGVNMRLRPGGVRELHWHKEAEWAYMLYGRARITAIDRDGHNFMDDVGVGDLWYFPPGIPHSIQGLQEGAEFILVFDDGDFSENSTFSITDWFAHTPKDVLAANFDIPASALSGIPSGERYIFQGEVPGPLEEDEIFNPNGSPPGGFSHRMLEQEPVRAGGGRVRIADSTNFPVATTVAAALVEVEPGGMRELHWHPNADEWQYYIEGKGRMTLFAAEGHARTFNYQAGDVGYVPFAMGHYIQNTGEEPLCFLEMFKSDHFADISLAQWMALTPPELVRDHLYASQELMGSLRKEKRPVVE
jgi:oxalate decarboxylase